MSATRANNQSSTLVLLATFAAVAATMLAGLVAAQANGVNQDTAIIEKPVHRANPFVPRLGKRMQQTTDQSNVDMEKVLCAYYGIDCKRFKKVPAKRSWSSLRSPLFARGTYNNNNYDDYDDYNNNDIRQPDSNLVDKTYNNNNNLEQFEDSDALSMLDNPFEPRAK